MSVIAKLMVRQAVQYGTGTFVELGCVCDNDLMAAYATSDEDKLFSRYSPWGEIRLNQRSGWAVFTHDADQHVEPPGAGPKAFYVMLLTDEEVSAASGEYGFPGAAAFVKVTCYSKTKFAGDGSRVELREVHNWKIGETNYQKRDSVIERMSWKMHVDNPPAEAGFTPGKDYWAVFYDAQSFSQKQAIRAALGLPEPTEDA